MDFIHIEVDEDSGLVDLDANVDDWRWVLSILEYSVKIMRKKHLEIDSDEVDVVRMH